MGDEYFWLKMSTEKFENVDQKDGNISSWTILEREDDLEGGQIQGNWKQVEHSGLNEFLTAQGIGWMKRKVCLKFHPVDTITINEKSVTISYKFYTGVGHMSGTNEYLIGQSTKIKNYHGEEIDAECSISNEKIITVLKGGREGTIEITRRIQDDKLYVEQKIVEKNISATRIFE